MSEPLTISWSQLRAHTECRQKAALIRAGRRTRAQNLRGYFHGMVVDSIMRDWLADPDRRDGTMVTKVDEYIDRGEREAIDSGDGVVRWRNGGDRLVLREFCTQLLDKLEPILHELVLPYRFWSAYTFRTPVIVPNLDGTPTTIVLRGEMDLLVERAPGQFVVWDLKGTKDDQYWRKVFGQLVFYDLAVLAERQHPTCEVGLIQPMCRQPVLRWNLTAEQRRQMYAAIHAMTTDIWREHLPCKQDTEHCSVCEVAHACPRYAPVAGTIPLFAATGRPSRKATS